MKKFRDLRESAPNIRAPADKDFWNKNVLLAPHAFSEPTKDNNVFKAANVKAFGGKRNLDQTQGEDQSQGYTSVIQFGDYVAHLLKMVEDNEYITNEEMDFLKEVAAHYEQRFRHGSMDENYVSKNSFTIEELHEETANKQTAFQRIKNKLKNRYKKVGKTVKDYKDDLKFGWEFGEETDINELSKGTLSRYIEGSSIDAVKKTQFADLNQRMAQNPSFGDREDRERAVRISDNENKKVAKRLRGVRLAARKMAEEKLTHKKWEGSTADNIVDRVAGYKEGGKKGEALDDRLVKAINKLTKEETLYEGIQNPNSSGQGYDPDHSKHKFHDIVTKYGYKYSHTTPIYRKDKSIGHYHTYKFGEHNVGLNSDSDVWKTNTSSASGHSWQGLGATELEYHLKSKKRRHGLKN